MNQIREKTIDTFKLVAVLGIFIGILLSLAVVFRLIVHSRLPKPVNQTLLSATTGLILGLGSLGLILLSQKFSDWTFITKLIYASKISVYVFIVAFIFSPIVTNKETNQK
jgi:hypothetical protein